MFSWKHGESTKPLKHFFKKGTVKIWSSALDGCCCLECCKLEGSAVPLRGHFALDGKRVKDPPLHDGCRCAFLIEENPEPQLLRDFRSFQMFSDLANTSDIFHSAETGYLASVYFLGKLAVASSRELKSAGLELPIGYNLSEKLQEILANKDIVFNQAIDRAYKNVVKQSVELKTQHGRSNRLLRFKEEILQSENLSQNNIAHLNAIIP